MTYPDTPIVTGGYLITADDKPIQLDTGAWFAWLETTAAFSQASQRLGSYHLHLRKRRSWSYWYAHVKISAKSSNGYAGPSVQIIAARLDEASLRLLDKGMPVRWTHRHLDYIRQSRQSPAV